MRSALWPRPRETGWRGAVGARIETNRAAYLGAFAAVRPRCLGELRLADMLAAGSITVDEFKAERAALLARL
jgi:hypothetical protein